MKITNIFLTTILVTTSVLAHAQFTGCKVADIEKLKSDGTVVVAISDDDATNKAAEEVMKSYWTVSKYKIIKKSELDGYVKANPENYILSYLYENSTTVFDMTQTQMASTNTKHMTQSRTVGDGLSLNKNVKKVKRLKPADAMIYTFIDADLDLANAQAEFIREVSGMNDIFAFPKLQDNQVGGWKIATLDHKEIITKELWISELDLNSKGEDDAKMKAAYAPYKYKVVTEEEIAKAIVEKRKDVVIVARAEYIAGGYMFLIHSPENGKVLFFMGGTAGFDAKSLEKVKNNKVYGN